MNTGENLCRLCSRCARSAAVISAYVGSQICSDFNRATDFAGEG